MTEFKTQPGTIRSYVNCLSGLFITKDNPQGLTPTECALISALLFKLPNQEKVTKDVKIEIANLTNNKLQVVTNYITKFRNKRVVIDNKLHPVFYKTKVVIEWIR